MTQINTQHIKERAERMAGVDSVYTWLAQQLVLLCDTYETAYQDGESAGYETARRDYSEPI